MTRLNRLLHKLTLNIFFEFCKWLIVAKCFFIGSSLLLIPHSYKSPTFKLIFASITRPWWGGVFLAVGLTVMVGIIGNNILWRLGAGASGAILFVWACGFPISGAFTRSPPSFFVWISAAVLDIFVALTLQPKVVENFLHEIERLPALDSE